MPLSNKQIDRLLELDARQRAGINVKSFSKDKTGTTKANENTGWLSPFNRIIWQGAFTLRKTYVCINDGRWFVIDYKRRPGSAYIKPVKGFAPQGYINIETALDADWIGGA